MRLGTSALEMNLEYATFVTNWIDSRGTRTCDGMVASRRSA